MPRIAGVDIPKQKSIQIALTYIYGIGRDTSGKLLADAEIEPTKRADELSDQEVAFSNNGETFSLLHRSTSYESFMNGALLAIRHVERSKGVAVGLDDLLGIQ